MPEFAAAVLDGHVDVHTERPELLHGALAGYPIHVAAQHGHTKIVQMLLAKGVRLARIGSGGHRALHYAFQYGHKRTCVSRHRWAGAAE